MMDKYGVDAAAELARLKAQLSKLSLDSPERNELMVAIRNLEEQLKESQS
jgi:hypothetical protein